MTELKNNRVDIRCTITYIYEKKKLAIMCPIGIIQESLDTLDIDHLGAMFNAGPTIAYPCDAIGIGEQMVKPIINRFGRIPDEAYAMVVGIEDSETEEELVELKAQYDELCPTYNELEEQGYRIYGVYYVINNIESFVDEDDVQRDVNNIGEIARFKVEEYDLQGLIEEVRENYKEELSIDNTPILLEGYEDKDTGVVEFSYNNEEYNKIGWDTVLNIQDINKYFEKNENVAIGIYFAHDDMEGNISMADGNVINESKINSGNIKLYEDTSLTIGVELIDGEYIFKQLYHTSGSCCSPASFTSEEDAGELTDRMLNLIMKHKK